MLNSNNLWKQETCLCEFFDELVNKVKLKFKDKNSEEFIKQLELAQPKVWIAQAANSACNIEYTTHPAKMTNPAAGGANDVATVTNILVKQQFVNNGYLYTGNSPFDNDGSTNARYLPILKFLELQLSDGRKLIEHLQEGSDIAVSLMDECENAERVRSLFLSTIQDKNNSTHSTSPLLTQVYFPVNDDYHLLTVLTPSSTLFELKKQLNHHTYSDETKAARSARFSGKSGSNYIEIQNLTAIGFGGTQPQNISQLNSKHGGVALLLDSTPPQILERKVTLPFFDFFYESVKFPKYQLKRFHDMANASKYVTDVENWRDSVLKEIFEVVVKSIFDVKITGPDGWSNKTQLPEHHCAIIDSALNEGCMNAEHVNLFLDDAVNHFIKNYKMIYNDASHELKELEVNFIHNLFKNCFEEAFL